MKPRKTSGAKVLLALLVGASVLLLDFEPLDPLAVASGRVVPEAEARIGHPLTPVSVAGVARRTTRRVIRRSTIYVAALPRNCTTVVIEGVSIYSCGADYYQPYGSQYVVVYVD